MNNSDITEHYLNKLYDDLHREQLNLMNCMKNTNLPNDDSGLKQVNITKQITLLNGLMMGALRLRNAKKAGQQTS